MHQAIPWFFIALAGACLVWALYAVWQSLRAAFGPEFEGEEAEAAVFGTDRRRTLLLEKEALLQNIKDLEFDHDAGKIGEDDFTRLHRTYRTRAKTVLRRLDDEVSPFRAEAEALVERHVRGVRPPSLSVAEGADPVSALEAEPPVEENEPRECPECTSSNAPDAEWCKSCGTRIAPTACPSCETVNDPDATFCKKCGGQLTEGAAERAPAGVRGPASTPARGLARSGSSVRKDPSR